MVKVITPHIRCVYKNPGVSGFLEEDLSAREGFPASRGLHRLRDAENRGCPVGVFKLSTAGRLWLAESLKSLTSFCPTRWDRTSNVPRMGQNE